MHEKLALIAAKAWNCSDVRVFKNFSQLSKISGQYSKKIISGSQSQN